MWSQLIWVSTGHDDIQDERRSARRIQGFLIIDDDCLITMLTTVKESAILHRSKQGAELRHSQLVNVRDKAKDNGNLIRIG